jgi:hypothetical protein
MLQLKLVFLNCTKLLKIIFLNFNQIRKKIKIDLRNI